MEESKLNLESVDIAEEKRAELLRLFPEAATDGGKIDFDQLKRALGEMVDTGRERYGISWSGKAECFRAIQARSTATLLPVRGESVRFDETENLIIEGDNLEVLKLLQKGYQGQAKMIYIDPPYNTNSDFIYPDDYADSLTNYLQYTGQADREGKLFSNNVEGDGRYHAKWLSMMYPRLYLAKNLLRDDGFFIVSIDDKELGNLRSLMNLTFEERNFVTLLVLDRNRKNDAKLVSAGHEYMMVYARDKERLKDLDIRLRAPKEGVEEVKAEFDRLRRLHSDDWEQVRRGLKDFYSSFEDDDPRLPLARFTKVDARGPYRTDGDPSWPGAGGPRYDVPHPLTGGPCRVPTRGWVWPTWERMKEEIDKGNVVFGDDETTSPGVRRDLFEKDDQVLRSVIFSYAQTSTQKLASIFDGLTVFENPKSVDDLERLIRYFTKPGDLVLDFFAGSGTTAEAVIQANRSEDRQRSFLCVQLPEPVLTDTKAGIDAASLGLRTISDITKERVRRVIRREDCEVEGRLDLRTADLPRRKEGFRVFKLAPSNFKVWDAHTDGGVEALEQQLELAVHNVRQDRTPEDLLYEILLKSEFPLTTPVARFDAAGIEAFSVQSDAMIVCVAHTLTEAAITAIAACKPLQVVFLDEAFSGNDQLKKNARLNFEAAGVTRFQTI